MAKWKIQALDQAVSSADARITLAIIDDSDSETTTDHMLSILSESLWTKYNKISWKLNPPELRSSEPIVDQDIFDNAEFHYCEPNPTKPIGNELPDDAVELAAEKCDLLFRTGFGIIQGAILTATEYGVLSYHTGDIRKYRGKPPGFWEYMNNERTVGITLQRLNETLDGGEIAVYKELNIEGQNTWKEVRYMANLEAIDMLSMAVQQIESGEYDPEFVDSLGDLYTTPDNLYTIKFLIKNTSGYLRSRLS
jgi:hypothetical protein